MLVESGNAAGRTRNTALSALYRRMIVRGGRKHAAFVVGRHIMTGRDLPETKLFALAFAAGAGAAREMLGARPRNPESAGA